MRDYTTLIKVETRNNNSSEAIKKVNNICKYINESTGSGTKASFVSVSCHGKGGKI